MADFFTTCFSVVMDPGDTTLSLANGTDYAIPGGVSEQDCLAYINSSRKSGMGAILNGGNQSPNDIGAYLGQGSDVINNLVLFRDNPNLVGGDDTRVTITVVCVINPTSPSRFWVRQRAALTLGSGDSTKTGAEIDGEGEFDAVIDPTRVWVCITGQQSEGTARNRAHRGHFTADFTGGKAELTRGDTGTEVHVSYAVVEFASDWKPVQRLTFTNSDLAGTIWNDGLPNDHDTLAIVADLGGTALTDVTRAFIDPQRRNSKNGPQGNDDNGDTVELSGTDELTIRHSTNFDSATKHHVVWVIEWNGSGGTAPVSEAVSNYVQGNSVGGTEEGGVSEGVISRTVTTVGSLTNACVIGASASSQGGGAGTPRGHVDFCLTDASTVTEKRSVIALSERRSYQVFQWPIGLSGTIGIYQAQAQNAGPEVIQARTSGPQASQPQNSGPASLQERNPGPEASQIQVGQADRIR